MSAVDGSRLKAAHTELKAGAIHFKQGREELTVLDTSAD